MQLHGSNTYNGLSAMQKEDLKEILVFKMMYREITYRIWNERNQRNFETRRQQWETIAKEIIYVSCIRSP